VSSEVRTACGSGRALALGARAPSPALMAKNQYFYFL
jgi:hypothetical protein